MPEMTEPMDRFDKLLKAMVEGEPHKSGKGGVALPADKVKPSAAKSDERPAD